MVGTTAPGLWRTPIIGTGLANRSRKAYEHSRWGVGLSFYDKAWRKKTMPRVKQTSKRKRGTKTVPVLGAAGLTLSLAGGASANVVGAADMPTTRNIAPGAEITIAEEEISDVSLATFYVFDKENTASQRAGTQLAWGGCRGCGGRGCRGCGGCRGCRGCGVGGCAWGCGGSCCISWGACRWAC
jgi:hypothetical protein